jgi:hypothetical protein
MLRCSKDNIATHRKKVKQFFCATQQKLAVLELWWSLFEKSPHSFLLVVQGKGGVKDSPLKEEPFREGAFVGPIDALFDHHDHGQ